MLLDHLRVIDEEKRWPSRAPAIGQHTDEVLGELGFTADDVEELRSAGVVA